MIEARGGEFFKRAGLVVSELDRCLVRFSGALGFRFRDVRFFNAPPAKAGTPYVGEVRSPGFSPLGAINTH